MKKMKLRKGDNVIVISGKDKTRTGEIIRVDLEKDRVYVKGCNIVKRHQRPVPGRTDSPGGVIEKEGPIHVSNVAFLDPKTNKPTRLGVRRDESGNRMRVAKRSGSEID